MDITITLSERTERIIRERANAEEKDVAVLASDLLEEKVIEETRYRPETAEPHPLLKFAGMFSSGVTDTSTRYKEILRHDIKMPGGFGGGE